MEGDRQRFVIGGGGHARSLVDVLRRLGCGSLTFITADRSMPEWAPEGSAVVDDAEALSAGLGLDCRWYLAIGDPGLRSQLSDTYGASGRRLFESVVAGTALLSDEASVERGAQVMEGVHVGPGARIGEFSIVNTGAIVEHDCHVGPFAHIAPGSTLLGEARAEFGSLIGARSVVLPRVRVGQGAIVGAGSIVLRDVPDNAVVTGIF